MTAIFQGKKLLLGVTGGIAAYKAVEVLRLLVTAGAQVQVVMTAGACQFITPLTFQALSGEPVRTALFGPAAEPLEHISLGQAVDAIVIAPATANCLGKMAAGIADDLLTTVILAATRPILVCPAMNVKMYENPVVQENLERLRQRGFQVLEPAVGEMACGAYGSGRLPEPADIVAALAGLLTPQDLAGVQVLVSAGPTYEDLDPVRFLTNRSTGKMGYAVAATARRRGAEVTLVSGPTALPAPFGVNLCQVRSALEMQAALAALFPHCDVLIMAAAVSDYRPAGLAAQKIKRGEPEMLVTLTSHPDLVAGLGARRQPHQVLVGFAAETQDLLAQAAAKLQRKGLDLIVANDVTAPDAGFAVDTNRVTILDKEGGVEALPLLSKDAVADRLLDRVAALLAERRR
ncbi:MAG: bifunctional phosphopantothenoylcysteine decarboxylase/phosphopantothenate--cysteine ligase CoaBC [Desulfobacca sp.]|uniref:bifunctional phosphopantothenoylcysteine decarboxylase/phosphopantothenate--cysteine ligase CoaBC n=1 Tax=Desulfobacca sp. TaxID=2067990 RepID=UPI0040490FF9